MKTKSWEVEVSADWETLRIILSDPKKTLPFFPYFEELRGEGVHFKVPRFIFNFGYEFEFDVGFGEGEAIYTFRRERGILTVTFKMVEGKLRVTASWAGFGEAIMGKPLENFARGIATAIKEFCASMKCPGVKIEGESGEVEHITPETAPAFLKRLAVELGTDFVVEGRAGDGTYLSAEIRGGNLRHLTVKTGISESVIDINVPVVELDSEPFEGLPLGKKFKIWTKKLQTI